MSPILSEMCGKYGFGMPLSRKVTKVCFCLHGKRFCHNGKRVPSYIT